MYIFFALRTRPRIFIAFVVSHLAWNWNTPLVVPNITLITTNHPLSPFWHSTYYAVDVECDFTECPLFNIANTTWKWHSLLLKHK